MKCYELLKDLDKELFLIIKCVEGDDLIVRTIETIGDNNLEDFEILYHTSITPNSIIVLIFTGKGIAVEVVKESYYLDLCRKELKEREFFDSVPHDHK